MSTKQKMDLAVEYARVTPYSAEELYIFLDGQPDMERARAILEASEATGFTPWGIDKLLAIFEKHGKAWNS